MTLTSVTGFARLSFSEFGDGTGTAYWYPIGGNVNRYTQFSQEVRLASKFDSPVNFTIGAFAQDSKEFYSTLGQGAIVGLQPDPTRGLQAGFITSIDTKIQTYSAFGQLRWDISPTLEFAAGGRYTHDKKKGVVGNSFVNSTVASRFLPEGVFLRPSLKASNFSPEATLSWHPIDGLMLYAAYRTAELAGGISATATIPSSATATNIVFRPEKARGYEAGLKFSAGSGVQGELTFYRTDYTDLQVAQFNSSTISYLLSNVGKARSQGVSLKGNYSVSDAITLRANAMYQDAQYLDYRGAQCYSGQTAASGCLSQAGGGTGQDLTGRTIARAPKFVASAGVAFEQPLGDHWTLGATADLRHSSSYLYEETLNPVAFQKNFETIDLGLRIFEDRWDFSLIGRNVTNEYYAASGVGQPTGRNGQVTAIVARPREIIFRVGRKF